VEGVMGNPWFFTSSVAAEPANLFFAIITGNSFELLALKG